MTTLRPTVSVVTVCYNSLPALQKTMESVNAQRYPALEYIIVDGGSTDGTSQYLESASIPCRWVSERDNGIYDAMNKGVSMATGDFVIFMNAGDIFASDDVLERVFDRGTDADVIYGDVIKGGSIKKAEAMHNSHRMFFCHQSCLARRERLVETPFDIRHRMSADFKWVKTMVKEGRRFMQVNFPIADFDTSGVSNSSRSRGLRDNMRVVSEVDSFIDRLKLMPRLLVPYIICRLRGK